MRNSRSKSIALNGAQPRVYRTYEDWKAEQERDSRTPQERGIHVGSSVMWRHMHNNIIVTDRAMVLAIADDILTLQVKDVKEKTCNAHISEIVSNIEDASQR